MRISIWETVHSFENIECGYLELYDTYISRPAKNQNEITYYVSREKHNNRGFKKSTSMPTRPGLIIVELTGSKEDVMEITNALTKAY